MARVVDGEEHVALIERKAKHASATPIDSTPGGSAATVMSWNDAPPTVIESRWYSG